LSLPSRRLPFLLGLLQPSRPLRLPRLKRPPLAARVAAGRV